MTDDEASTRRRSFVALLDACRLWLGTETTGALTAENLDWDTFGELAFVHNLEPLLHRLRADERLVRGDIPSALCDRWERNYFENFVFNTRALEIIQPFCAACEDRRLAITLIKGPVISARAFDDPALRIMVDLDVLCRENDLAELVQLAGEVGFAGAAENAVYHVSLRHQELALLLELHFQLYDFLPRDLLEVILETAETCRQDDFAFPAPPLEIELAIEIAHLVNHDLQVNLKPLLDLASGLRTLPSSGPLSETLRRWDLEPEGAIIGQLLERLFGERTVLGRHQVPAYGESIIDDAMRCVEEAERLVQPALAELVTRPGFLSRLGYLSRLLRPSRRRLGAVGEGTGWSSHWTHVGRTFGRGWRKLIRSGLASAASPSIKRELFRRRQSTRG